LFLKKVIYVRRLKSTPAPSLMVILVVNIDLKIYICSIMMDNIFEIDKIFEKDFTFIPFPRELAEQLVFDISGFNGWDEYDSADNFVDEFYYSLLRDMKTYDVYKGYNIDKIEISISIISYKRSMDNNFIWYYPKLDVRIKYGSSIFEFTYDMSGDEFDRLEYNRILNSL
jgi:hypothetical protein